MKYWNYISTLYKLGVFNVAYMLWYRLSMRLGIRKFRFKIKEFNNTESFFSSVDKRTDYPEQWKKDLLNDANKILDGKIKYYSVHWQELGNLPNWFLNPFNEQTAKNVHLHWTKLSDFNPELGDIKNIWEISRFEWVNTLARAYAVSGNEKYRKALNNWLKDWAIRNPLNTGPNWKCGQEASIRVFNLLNTLFILNQHKNPSETIKEFVYWSLQRINGNIYYAIAQDNNHGTSEATALFIGGTWLYSIDKRRYSKAKKYAQKGRKWLENRVTKLIAENGSFSQHSTNYHRVVLDTLTIAEHWRKTLNAKVFSNVFYIKSQKCIQWLQALTDETNGKVPNLGSNDGAYLLNMHNKSYLDYRPSIEIASLLFEGSKQTTTSLSDNEVAYWLKLKKQETVAHTSAPQLYSEGYTTLRGTNSWALIRWPHFKFRPSHNDVLHIDLWYKGKNVLCDSGTYSYNSGSSFPHDLKSVHFHNTVAFDEHEQMPKLSRFLLGNWLIPDNKPLKHSHLDGQCHFNGAYRDSHGNRHERIVSVKNDKWIVNDILAGSFNLAKIGFNINDSNCKLENNKLLTDSMLVTFPSSVKVQLTNSIVSNYYWEKHSIKRLILKVNQPGDYKTIFEFKND